MIHDPNDGETDSAPPGILGMYISQGCKQFILAEFDNALEGTLDADWRDAFNREWRRPLWSGWQAHISCIYLQPPSLHFRLEHTNN